MSVDVYVCVSMYICTYVYRITYVLVLRQWDHPTEGARQGSGSRVGGLLWLSG